VQYKWKAWFKLLSKEMKSTFATKLRERFVFFQLFCVKIPHDTMKFRIEIMVWKVRTWI